MYFNGYRKQWPRLNPLRRSDADLLMYLEKFYFKDKNNKKTTPTLLVERAPFPINHVIPTFPFINICQFVTGTSDIETVEII